MRASRSAVREALRPNCASSRWSGWASPTRRPSPRCCTVRSIRCIATVRVRGCARSFRSGISNGGCSPSASGTPPGSPEPDRDIPAGGRAFSVRTSGRRLNCRRCSCRYVYAETARRRLSGHPYIRTSACTSVRTSTHVSARASDCILVRISIHISIHISVLVSALSPPAPSLGSHPSSTVPDRWFASRFAIPFCDPVR